MNNKLTELFQLKNSDLLNVYCTAGYPAKDSTLKVLSALQKNGVDIIEVGMPYSDPIADGPVIQQSNMQALENGMTIELLFTQLNEAKPSINVPIILMGYLNPVLQFGIEKFCKAAAEAGISGLILPDLPMHEYEEMYSAMFKQYNLSFIFLVTPQTSAERIKKADKLSTGFLYAVSSSATTGTSGNVEDKKAYFERIAAMKLKNPLMIGFGINDKSSYENACMYARGGIIGSAYIKALGISGDVEDATKTFLETIR
jgi:tryptophan synthase alpha chain